MNLKNSKTAYIQIAEYYKKLIDLGSFKEGDALPSVREAALFFGVNPNTVQSAFTFLVNENYLQNIYKKGFFVKTKNVNKDDLIKECLNDLFDKGIKKEEIIEYLKKEGELDDWN